MTSTTRFRLWCLILVLASLIVIARSVIFGVPGILSPLASSGDPMNIIIPALAKRVNTFALTNRPISLVKTAEASEAPPAYESAPAYIVIDYDTGDIIAEKNGDGKLPIASLTKIMSAVVALDLASPSEMFTVSRTASEIIPTKIGVKPGEKLTLDELLHAALLTSANDAVEVIKDGINRKYGYDIFVKAMNAKATMLGLTDSHFANPQGFDSQLNYSSVRDLAVLSHYALTEYPEIAAIVGQDFRHLSANKYHRQFDLYNWNGLIDVYPNVFGVKIGNTGDAGTTTVVGAAREGKRVLTVLLGAKNVLQRDLWAADLLDVGFDKLGHMKAIAVTTDQLQRKYATWKIWN